MSLQRIPFDLKFSKLQGSQWDRINLQNLAKQLMLNQGSARYSIENRIIILFDKSTTSSLDFLQRNEVIILQKVIQMLREPDKYWHKITIENKDVLVCLILIPENEYVKIQESHEHRIGNGLREKDKADFAHKLLEHCCWVSDGKIESHNNPKEHGIDGYIFLPKSLLEKLGWVEARKQDDNLLHYYPKEEV